MAGRDKRGMKKGPSIFTRLLIALLGVVVLVSGTLTAVFYIYSRRSLEKQTTENILQQFSMIGYHFRYELRNSLVNNLQMLSSNPALDEFLMSSDIEREIAARSVERFFLESLKYDRSYESISFIGQRGVEAIKVDRSGRVRDYRNLSDRPFFDRIRRGSPGGIDVENPALDAAGNVLFSAAIFKTDADIGRFGGAVVITYNLKRFVEYLDRIRIFNENPVWLFTPDGTVVKKPGDPRTLLDPRPYLAPGLQKEPLLVTTGGGMLIYQDLFINAGSPVLRLAVSIPSSLLLQDMRKVLQFFLFVAVLSLLVISALAYYLAGFLSRPLTEIARAASRLAKGDLATRVRGTASGEVQLLIDSFNRMGEELEKTTVSKEYIDDIISSMTDALIVTSPAGIISRINLAASVLLEYDEAELVGQPLSRVIQEETDSVTPTLDLVLQRGSLSTVEKTCRTKNDKKIPVLFSASVMRDEENGVQGVVCVAQDITARKQTEARLKAYSADLQEINEELKNFAYIVSHDLRAPLVNIKGFSEELSRSLKEINPCFQKHLPMLEEAERETIAPILTKDVPEALAFIGTSVNRMDNLINAILKLSRAGRRRLLPEPVSVHDLVQGILKSLGHQIGSRHICVAVHAMPDVVADRMALEQIFGNLIDNAVKYLDPGRNGELDLSAVRNEDEVIFHIRDNGRGIAQEDIPKIFEIFRRAGRQDVPGEGMGLAYVKTLVRLQGGRIWCESEAGRGSTFSFTLPQPVRTNYHFPAGRD